jgi:hypothetical protein
MVSAGADCLSEQNGLGSFPHGVYHLTTTSHIAASIKSVEHVVAVPACNSNIQKAKGEDPAPQEFKASLGYIVRSCLSQKEKSLENILLNMNSV